MVRRRNQRCGGAAIAATRRQDRAPADTATRRRRRPCGRKAARVVVVAAAMVKEWSGQAGWAEDGCGSFHPAEITARVNGKTGDADKLNISIIILTGDNSGRGTCTDNGPRKNGFRAAQYGPTLYKRRQDQFDQVLKQQDQLESDCHVRL